MAGWEAALASSFWKELEEGGNLGWVYLEAEAQAWRGAAPAPARGLGCGRASGAGTRAGTRGRGGTGDWVWVDGAAMGEGPPRPGSGRTLGNQSAREGGARDLVGMDRPGAGGFFGCEGSRGFGIARDRWRGGRVPALPTAAAARRAGVRAPGAGGGRAAGRGLTIQALHGQHVVPAEQRVAAQPLVVGRHERARRRRVRQAERVADLVRQHHEQVAPAAAAQGPALVAVEVRFAPAGQEGVRQGAPCRRRRGSGEAAWCPYSVGPNC